MQKMLKINTDRLPIPPWQLLDLIIPEPGAWFVTLYVTHFAHPINEAEAHLSPLPAQFQSPNFNGHFQILIGDLMDF